MIKDEFLIVACGDAINLNFVKKFFLNAACVLGNCEARNCRRLCHSLCHLQKHFHLPKLSSKADKRHDLNLNRQAL